MCDYIYKSTGSLLLFSHLQTTMSSIKFRKENSAVSIFVEGKDKEAIVAITDNGIGIPEKSLPVIFEAFTSAKRCGTSGKRSFGLGMSICRQIVEANSSRIRVESAEDQGSTFFITLPLSDVNEQERL